MHIFPNRHRVSGTHLHMLDFQFLPDTMAARRTNARMHDGLFESLAYLSEVLSERQPGLPQACAVWRQSVGADQRVPSSVFGAYYDAVEAIQADQPDEAVALLQRIFLTPPEALQTRVNMLGRDYSAEAGARIMKFMGAPETGVAGVTEPDPVKAARFADRLDTALDWIARNLPELHGEMNALLGELVLVGPVEGSLEFEGGTCFRLWGAVALNAERKASVADLIVTLAHEEGHAALFGACRNEMLVENPDSELYWSPIRQTERPLEGIFHAAFVSARMMWALCRMLDSGDFGWLERRRLSAMLKQVESVQRESAEIVREEGRLTGTGAAVLRAMTEFINGTGRQFEPA